jgi:GH24 family phage-related lysozyme (muramidase)
MTVATIRSAVEHAVRQGHLLPHQLAALTALDQRLTTEQRQAFTDDWRAAGSPAAPRPPLWLEPARRIVSEFEGCRLQAYLCPAGVPTIGYGHTHGVKLGQTITQQQAESLLDQDLARFAGGIHELIPASRNLGGNQQAALISWAFNVGLGAVERSTLRRRINAGESPVVVVPAELPRWNKASGMVLPGLTRRRNAEVAMFTSGGQPTAPAEIVITRAPYFFQRDSATAQGDRMCYSSTCAMAVETLKPGALAGPGQADDRYLRLLQSLGGDTTDVQAQLRTLKSLGINATFRQDLGMAPVEAELKAGRPVPVGWLHQGPINAPSGGGHWSLIVGATDTSWILHDPFGEANMVTGGYVSTTATAGRFVRYTKENFNRRWMVEPYRGAYRFAPGKGWGLLLRLA